MMLVHTSKQSHNSYVINLNLKVAITLVKNGKLLSPHASIIAAFDVSIVSQTLALGHAGKLDQTA